jgi:hypothetical protein
MGVCPARRVVEEELPVAEQPPLAAARAYARARRHWRAAVNLIKHHLRKRLAWHWYGKRLQQKPGLGSIFDRVVRKRGKLQNV